MAIKTKRFINLRKSYSCSMPGVWSAVAYCRGTVVIFHSPRACAHVARTMDINSHYRSMAEERNELMPSVPLLSSQLEEKHSIFGGVERLSQCVDFALKQYKPQCLVIANSCVAGVIGDDVDAVARSAEEQYGIPVLTVDCCGFLDGEYYQGYFEITEQLVERFLQPCETLPGTVLLLGDNGGPWGHYAVEVTRLLSLMGVKVIGQFPSYMAFEDLPKAASAETVIILGGRGQTHIGLSKIAAQLQSRLGIPYLDVYPVGWQQTRRWISAAGKLLGREREAAAVLAAEEKRMAEGIRRFTAVTRDKKAVLCIGRLLMYYDPVATLSTIKMLEMELTGIVLLDAYRDKEREEMLRTIRSYTNIPVYSPAEGEAALAAADIVLTTHELQDKKLKQLFLPMLPKVGSSGELDFMEAVYRALCSRLKGGMIYV